MSAEDIARQFHDTYERLAPAHGWETQERSRVEWDDLPAENRALMVAVVADVVGPILAGLGAARAEATRLREALGQIAAMPLPDAYHLAHLARTAIAPPPGEPTDG